MSAMVDSGLVSRTYDVSARDTPRPLFLPQTATMPDAYMIRQGWPGPKLEEDAFWVIYSTHEEVSSALGWHDTAVRLRIGGVSHLAGKAKQPAKRVKPPRSKMIG